MPLDLRKHANVFPDRAGGQTELNRNAGAGGGGGGVWLEGGGSPCCLSPWGTEFCCAGVLGDELVLPGDTDN